MQLTIIERAESEGYKDRLNLLLDQFKVNEPLKKRWRRERND